MYYSFFKAWCKLISFKCRRGTRGFHCSLSLNRSAIKLQQLPVNQTASSFINKTPLWPCDVPGLSQPMETLTPQKTLRGRPFLCRELCKTGLLYHKKRELVSFLWKVFFVRVHDDGRMSGGGVVMEIGCFRRLFDATLYFFFENVSINSSHWWPNILMSDWLLRRKKDQRKMKVCNVGIVHVCLLLPLRLYKECSKMLKTGHGAPEIPFFLLEEKHLDIWLQWLGLHSF